MSTIDTSRIYVLKNAYTGPNKILAMAPNGTPPVMVDAASPRPNALWFLTPANTGNNGPYYRLHSVSNGEEQSLSTKAGDGDNLIWLSMFTTGNYGNQYWRLDTGTNDAAYPYLVSNVLDGQAKHWEISPSTQSVYLGTGDTTGQHWRLESAPTTTPFKIPKGRSRRSA